MINIESKLTGDLEGAMAKFANDVQEKVLFAGAAAMAGVMYDEVKANVPVKTGLLRDSVYRVYSKDRSSESVKTYHISVNKRKAPHWALIEFGTSRAAAKPYIRPALSRTSDAIDAGLARMSEKMGEL